MVSAAQGLVEPGQVWFIHHSGTAPDEVESLRRAADWNQIVVSSSSPIGDKQRGEDEWMGWLCEGMTCRPATTNADDLIWKATGEFTK